MQLHVVDLSFTERNFPCKCMVYTPLDMHRKGVILEQAYGGPSSVPGKAALLTGRYSSRSSVLPFPNSKIVCCHRLVDLQGLPLVLMPFFILIFYRTGLPLVSPATLEPMGLPTNFKLLPKVELITPPTFQ